LVGSLTAHLEGELKKPLPSDRWDAPELIYGHRVWWLNSLRAEAAEDVPRALEFVERAIALRSREISYLQRRGALLQQLGRKQEAAEAFQAANEQEALQGRLTEIVLGGDLQQLTPERCNELAEVCRKRNKPIQEAAWRRATESGS
jgi:tetratricopeptide (TPR) repeat protein